MGKTLENYKANIGAFYSITHRLICLRNSEIRIRNSDFHIKLSFYAYCAVNIFGLLSLAGFVKKGQFRCYRLVQKDRTRNGGGLLVYLSSLLKCKLRPDLEKNPNRNDTGGGKTQRYKSIIMLSVTK